MLRHLRVFLGLISSEKILIYSVFLTHTVLVFLSLLSAALDSL